MATQKQNGTSTHRDDSKKSKKSSPSSVSPERLAALHGGTSESGNLAEGLALDFALLAELAVPSCPKAVTEGLRAVADKGIVERMQRAAALLLEHCGADSFLALQSHTSDTVRGWACFMLGALPDVSLGSLLERLRPLADDSHFGVREWVWMAVRPRLAASLEESIGLLDPWTREASPRVRRFACESLRPRGVWCRHIDALKENPALMLPVLEPLKADPEMYVQDSVSNWLNDAAKSRPEWVEELCARWSGESPVPATLRICKRAVRSIANKG